MDSFTIKEGAKKDQKDTVTLGGVEFSIENLQTNMANANYDTVSIELTNEVTKEEDGVKLQV